MMFDNFLFGLLNRDSLNMVCSKLNTNIPNHNLEVTVSPSME